MLSLPHIAAVTFPVDMNMEPSEDWCAASSMRPTHLLDEFAYKITCAVNLQLSCTE
jgi:hypothetical protein